MGGRVSGLREMAGSVDGWVGWVNSWEGRNGWVG